MYKRQDRDRAEQICTNPVFSKCVFVSVCESLCVSLCVWEGGAPIHAVLSESDVQTVDHAKFLLHNSVIFFLIFFFLSDCF